MKVTDPGTLSRIAAVLRTDPHPAAAVGVVGSGDPDRLDTARLKSVEAACTRLDDRVVKHVTEDRLLATQGQAAPAGCEIVGAENAVQG